PWSPDRVELATRPASPSLGRARQVLRTVPPTWHGRPWLVEQRCDVSSTAGSDADTAGARSAVGTGRISPGAERAGSADAPRPRTRSTAPRAPDRGSRARSRRSAPPNARG